MSSLYDTPPKYELASKILLNTKFSAALSLFNRNGANTRREMERDSNDHDGFGVEKEIIRAVARWALDNPFDNRDGASLGHF